MAQAPKKVIYTDMDDAAVCRSDGTIIPPKYKLPIKTSRPVLIFGEAEENVGEVVEENTEEDADGEAR